MTDEAGAEGTDTAADTTEAAVLRFLGERPDFLRQHPSLYLTLEPPARVHGDRLADHMAALLAAARAENSRLRDGLRRRRDDASFGERVEAALLGALRSGDALEWMATELAPTLGLDSASICVERRRPYTRLLAPGGAASLLGDAPVRFRPAPSDGAHLHAAHLHGEASPLVRGDVLLRLALPEGGDGVLALGSRDERLLPGPGAGRALSVLARGVEAALERP